MPPIRVVLIFVRGEVRQGVTAADFLCWPGGGTETMRSISRGVAIANLVLVLGGRSTRFLRPWPLFCSAGASGGGRGLHWCSQRRRGGIVGGFASPSGALLEVSRALWPLLGGPGAAWWPSQVPKRTPPQRSALEELFRVWKRSTQTIHFVCNVQ